MNPQEPQPAQELSPDDLLLKNQLEAKSLQALSFLSEELDAIINIPETNITQNATLLANVREELARIDGSLSGAGAGLLATEEIKKRVNDLREIVSQKEKRLNSLLVTPKEDDLAATKKAYEEKHAQEIEKDVEERRQEAVSTLKELEVLATKPLEELKSAYFSSDVPTKSIIENLKKSPFSEIVERAKILENTILTRINNEVAQDTTAEQTFEKQRGELEAAKIDANLSLSELRDQLPSLKNSILSLKGSTSKEISDEAVRLEAYLEDKLNGVTDSITSSQPINTPEVSVEDIILPPEVSPEKTKEENDAALTKIRKSVTDLPTTLHEINDRLENYKVFLHALAGDTTYDGSVRARATEALMTLEVLRDAKEHAKVDINLDEPADEKSDAGGTVIDIGIVTPATTIQQTQPEASLVDPLSLEELKARGLIKSNREIPSVAPATPEASPKRSWFSRVLRPEPKVQIVRGGSIMDGIRRVLRTKSPQDISMTEPSVPKVTDPELLKQGEEIFGTKNSPDTLISKKEMSPTAFAERQAELSVKLEKMRIARGEKASLLERTGKITKNAWEGWKSLGKNYNELPKEKKILLGLGLAAGTFAFGAGAVAIPYAALRIISSAGLFLTLDKAMEVAHIAKTGEERTTFEKYRQKALAFTFATLVGSGMAAEAAKELFSANLIDLKPSSELKISPPPLDEPSTSWGTTETPSVKNTPDSFTSTVDPGTPEGVVLKEYPVQSGDTLYKIIRENFGDIKSLPAGQQEAAIENILKHIKGDPASYGISSGDVNTIIAGKDTINLQKISDLLQAPNIVNGEGIIEHVQKLNPETIINNNVPVPPAPSIPLESIPIPDSQPIQINTTVPMDTITPAIDGTPSVPTENQFVPDDSLSPETGDISSDPILEETKTAMKTRIDSIFGTKDIFGVVQTGGELSQAWLQIKEKSIGDLLAETSPNTTTTAVKNMLGNLSLESGLPVVRGEHVADYMERALLKISENKAEAIA